MSLPSDEAWASRQIIEGLARECARLQDRDMLTLLRRARRLPDVGMHGPEHHGLVAAVVLTAYRNAGGEIADEEIVEGALRANSIPGRSCGHLGVCGAATGVGAAFSVLLGSTPLKAAEKQAVQEAVLEASRDIWELGAPRCCQRESVLALKRAAALSKTRLQVALPADDNFTCDHSEANAECIAEKCPLHPDAAKQ